MPTITKKLVYHSHIASHIQYGLLLWSNNATESQLNKLQKIQNKCLKYLLPKETPRKSKKKTLLPKHQYNTRNRNTPNLPKDASKLYRDSFLYKGSHSILSIDINTQNSRTLSIFTNKCKAILLNE